MNWRKATLQELVTVRYHDEQASMGDKIEAEKEIVRRQRKQRSGRPARVTKRMELWR